MKRICTLFSALLYPCLSFADIPAFPSAEGFGRYAEGGRGGDVYIVTNLADEGPGSLRDCVEAYGPRTCVFEVSGDIFLEGELRVENPDLTIAGQTAPGQGVQVIADESNTNGFFLDAGNIIIRHIKIRLGPSLRDAIDHSCFRIGGGTEVPTDIIIDHVSCAWARDQLIVINAQDRTTIQDSFFYEALYDGASDAPRANGPDIRSCGVSMIRNLIASNVFGNPSNDCGTADPPVANNPQNGENEIRNNLVYNGGSAFLDYLNGRGESWLNLVGNHFIGGPDTQILNDMPYGVDAQDVTSPESGEVSGAAHHLCMQDNIGEGVAGVPPSDPVNPMRDPAIHGVLNPDDADLVESVDCVNDPVVDPRDPRILTGFPMPATDVEAWVLENAGAMPWNRDAADERVATEVAARDGGVIGHPDDAGGWPDLQSDPPPLDRDRDGMPDQWEADNGLDPANPADRNGDANNDGYTNLEEYLNQRAQDVAPPRPQVRMKAPFGVRGGPPESSCGPKGNLGLQMLGSEGVATEFCIKRRGSRNQSTWWRVDFADGPDGWVRGDYLEVD